MATPRKAEVKQANHFASEFDKDYERIMQLAKLATPLIGLRRGITDEPQQGETITTYGVEVTTF